MRRRIYASLMVAAAIALLFPSNLTVVAMAFNVFSPGSDKGVGLRPQSPVGEEFQLSGSSFFMQGGFGSMLSTFSDYRCYFTAEDSAQLIIGVDYSNPLAYKVIVNAVTFNGGKIVNEVSLGGKAVAVVVDIPRKRLPSFREQMSRNPAVRYVEPNMKRRALFEPNDSYWSLQWSLKKIEANWAWNTTFGSSGIIVALVDTGIDYYHEDLAANYVPLGYDWVNYDPDPFDDNGHGTHCAGIISAVLNNGVGIAGIAQVKIMAEKVLDSSGYGFDDWIANGIVHAVDQGAKIISMSFGGYGYSSLLHEAVRYAYERGVLLVAAAGNDNVDSKLYPAAYPETIAVSATDEYDEKTFFSNWGDWIELSAPGVNIYSTVPRGYASASGTSVSCPHISGVAALIWSLYPSATNDWVRAQLRYTADDLGKPGFDVYFGYGRVNAKKSVEQKPPEHDLLVLNAQGPQYVCPGDVAYYDVTVLNFGRNDEVGVNVTFIINGHIVDYRYIGFFKSGSSNAVTFSWSPMMEGIYNATFWVKPVAGEVNVGNNKVELFLTATYPLINPIAGQWASYEFNQYDPKTGKKVYSEYWNITYVGYIEPYKVYVTIRVQNVYGFIFEGWMIVNTLSRLVEEGVWAGLWYPGWIETDIDVGSTVNLLFGSALVAGSRVLLVGIYPIKCWELTFWEPSGVQYLFWYDKVTGLWVGMDVYSDHYFLGDLRLKKTNVPTGEKYPHELAVTLEAPPRLEPNSTIIFNATAYNIGLNDELNVKLSLLINGTEVMSETLSVLPSNSSYTVSYAWTPLVEAYFNVTAYVQPVSDEFTTLNNIATKIVRSVKIRGHVLFDQTHSVDGIPVYSEWVTALEDEGYIVEVLNIAPVDESILGGYDVFVIPQARDYYMPSEIDAIKAFVNNGGGLLVIGDDSPYIYVEVTGFAGINWDWDGYYGYTYDITPHPVTEGVESVYFASPSSRLLVRRPALGLIRDHYGNVMLAVAEVGKGAVACIADEDSINNYAISYADNLHLAINMIRWLTNRPPHVSVWYSPQDPYVGEAVVFDASASYDPDGVVVGYIWDFGDGIVEEGGAVIMHLYANSGAYIVSCTAVDNEGSSATLKIEVKVQRTALNVQVKAGSIHFAGEIADFHILVSRLGEPVDADISVQLYFNGILYADLTDAVKPIGEGFCRVSYTIPWNASAGTYVLIVRAEYYSLSGASIENFQVSQTLAGWNAWIKEIRDNIATVVVPNLGEISLNLTAVNRNLQEVSLTTARIETTLDVLNGTVMEIKDGIATIVVPKLGETQLDVSKIILRQEVWEVPQYLTLAFSVIAALCAASTAALLLKHRKL